ncbi:MAG: hypothetical protein QOJ62_662 [Actinomycetota bacterium]|jgi:NAD(P)-dependent dehydrogenase (short-subunit alcohol dehydrogenase family)|nr:hypothetical protein [Actinomycetota bacterium]
MHLGLQGKVAVVTAGGSGIGLAVAQAFAAEGATVVVGDLDTTAVSSTAGIVAHRLDLLETDAPRLLIEQALAETGRVDILVNAMGGPTHRGEGFLAIDDDAWRRSLDLNLLTLIRTCRAAIPHMVRGGGGSIVHLASDAARQPDPIFVDYCVAKAALLSLSKALSIEFASRGIRSNCVSPGPTNTPGFMNFFTAHVAPQWGVTAVEAVDRFVHEIRKIPAGKLGEPTDVARVVVFLASDAAKHVTGSDYRVDGGVVISP